MSHLSRFSLISRQVVHPLHHLTWIRGIFAADGHSQCGKTAHLTQLHYVFAAGGNNMALPMSHLTRFSLISRQVVHSLHHLAWIRDIFAAGGWAFSVREDGPPDTVTFRFRGRWEDSIK